MRLDREVVSDLLLELGDGVELATVTVPQLLLPLACATNVAKVLSLSSGENIGDVIPKGDCVGNIADLASMLRLIPIFQQPPFLDQGAASMLVSWMIWLVLAEISHMLLLP